jgi:hypothetical protein
MRSLQSTLALWLLKVELAGKKHEVAGAAGQRSASDRARLIS